jgi:hypothetical protein
MLHVTFSRIKPGKEAALRAWLAELSAREDEVRLTFIDERVRHEQASILQLSDGPVLVYAIESESSDHGKGITDKSQHPIDEEHRQIMESCLGSRLEVPLLFDVALNHADENGI